MKDFLATVFIVIAVIGIFVVMGNFAKKFTINSGSSATWFTKWSVANPTERVHLQVDVSDADLWAPATPGLSGDSEWKGQITFDSLDADPQNENPDNELLSLRASIQNTKPIPLKGWSLQSLVSGARIPLPKGVLFYVLGRDNKYTDVVLAPGESLYVISGKSPLTASFHTNSCMGQLSEGRVFVPPLQASCPSPSELLPATIENIQSYGEECIEYVHSLSSCETPGHNTPTELLPACRAFVAEKLTYNKCVEREYKKGGYSMFNFGGWYLYLNSAAEIWRNKYDVIRLLDPAGRVVDVTSY